MFNVSFSVHFNEKSVSGVLRKVFRRKTVKKKIIARNEMRKKKFIEENGKHDKFIFLCKQISRGSFRENLWNK